MEKLKQKFLPKTKNQKDIDVNQRQGLNKERNELKHFNKIITDD